MLDHRLLSELTDVSFNVRELQLGSSFTGFGEALLTATFLEWLYARILLCRNLHGLSKNYK